jgi:ketosteroid isomerase-like protein
MSEDHPNVAVARELWTAIADSDADRMSQVLADGVVWRSMGQNPLSGEYHGPDGVVDYLVEVGSRADRLASDLLKVFVHDDGVVVLYHVSAQREERTLELEVLLTMQIANGKIVSALSVPVDQRVNDEFWAD